MKLQQARPLRQANNRRPHTRTATPRAAGMLAAPLGRDGGDRDPTRAPSKEQKPARSRPAASVGAHSPAARIEIEASVARTAPSSGGGLRLGGFSRLCAPPPGVCARATVLVPDRYGVCSLRSLRGKKEASPCTWNLHQNPWRTSEGKKKIAGGNIRDSVNWSVGIGLRLAVQTSCNSLKIS